MQFVMVDKGIFTPIAVWRWDFINKNNTKKRLHLVITRIMRNSENTAKYLVQT